MEQYNIHLTNTTHLCNLYTGSTQEAVNIHLRDHIYNINVFSDASLLENGASVPLDVRLRNHLENINIFLETLLLRNNIVIDNDLILSASNILGELYECIHPNGIKLTLESDCARWLTLTVFERCRCVNELKDIIGEILAEKSISGVANSAVITQSDIRIASGLFSVCSDILSFLDSSIIDNVQFSYCCKIPNTIELTTELSGNGVVNKSVSTQHLMSLIHNANCLLEVLIGISKQSALTLFSDLLNAVMLRYMMLKELDKSNNISMSLDQYYHLTLNDMYYTEI